MGYCGIQQLEDRLSLPVLGQRVPETGAERLRILNGYIERASAFIDSRLAIKYNVPVQQNKLLEDICLTMVLWQVEADRGTTGREMPARVQVPYDEAMKTLTDLASGRIDLSGGKAVEGQVAGLTVRSPVAIFNPESPGMEYF
jgi:phage gp36-like protein